MVMITNDLNVFSQIFTSCNKRIQLELEKIAKILHESLILETHNFLSKLKIFIKQRKNIVSASVFLVMRIGKNF